jgi:RNA polymerase sigma factor (sigma-70 family)
MDTDNQLLERYARDSSEAAFRELVERHINLVHSAALRESNGNASLAQDITQAVFTELARHPAKLVRHPALAGWLYTCVRRKSANVRRTEERRHRREHEAFIMNELLGSDPTDQLWHEVRPVLDDAMHELDEEDRAAVVLRFFEGRNLKDIGLALGLSENAARMRVERSLEKLRSLLARRGVKSTASTLATVVASGAVMTAPSTLASAIATSALATAGASGSATFAMGKMLGITKTQVAVTGALVVTIGVFTLWNKVHSDRASVASPEQTQAALADTSPSVGTTGRTQDALASAVSSPTNSIAPPQMPLQIVDSESGDPLASAMIYLAYFRQDGRTQRMRRTTDAAGKVGIEIAQSPVQALNMFVTADGHVPKVISWGYGRPMPASYTMRMERGITIGGMVVDESGLPITGAKIEIDGPGNDRAQEENIQFGPDTILHTDADGRWTCNMMPKDAETISLIVTHPDFAEAKVPVRTSAADAKESTITMPTGFVVAGTVEDSAGNAIEGAKVRQARLNGDRERSGKTDASGAFEFRSMKAGELLLAVQAEGFAPAAQTLQLTGALAGIRFRLAPGRLLRGHVVDEDGKPIPDARVTTTPSDIDKVEWSGRTDAGGRFAWESAPQETVAYSIRADGFEIAYGLKLPADGSDHEIRLTRERPTDENRITGTVVDADTDLPLETFKVMRRDVEPEFAFPFEFVATGKAGQFSLSFSEKSRYPSCQLVIEKEGFIPEVSATFAKKGGNQAFSFRLRKGSGPSGVVLLADGSPAANATVLLCTSEAGVTLDGPARIGRGLNTTTHRVQTDQAGKFALPAAASPQGVMAVHDQGYGEISLANLRSNGQLTLQSWGRVEGQLVLESRPAANERVVAYHQVIRYDEEGRHFGYLTCRFETKTDSAGKFAFEKVPSGQCQVFRELERSYTAFQSHRKSIAVHAGELTQVALGGGGRTVLGKAVFTEEPNTYDWRSATVSLRLKDDPEPGPRPRRANYPSRDAYVEAAESFFQAYRKLRQFYALCDSSGTFRIPDVPAGAYLLEIQLRDIKVNSLNQPKLGDPPKNAASLIREVVVPEIPEGQSAESLDLGTLELTPYQAK